MHEHLDSQKGFWLRGEICQLSQQLLLPSCVALDDRLDVSQLRNDVKPTGPSEQPAKAFVNNRRQKVALSLRKPIELFGPEPTASIQVDRRFGQSVHVRDKCLHQGPEAAASPLR